MSGIQRWHASAADAHPMLKGWFVTYIDHLGALRACQDRLSIQKDELVGLTAFRSYRKGYESALDAAEEVIYALDSIEDEANGYSYPDRTTQEIVDAIRNLREVK